MTTKRAYEVLGIPYGASQDHIKASYRLLIQQYHPDQFQTQPQTRVRHVTIAPEAAQIATAAPGHCTAVTGGGWLRQKFRRVGRHCGRVSAGNGGWLNGSMPIL